ncbi:uncharacterized protein LOC143857860 isoform X2 [Tasmannia lanceolata]|uniref:uncharacterized protein LOC143857860 isoform X2 n=1 Tax=Tasmannia lanceolata TaxID=3420 RepID=UPI0040646462
MISSSNSSPVSLSKEVEVEESVSESNTFLSTTNINPWNKLEPSQIVYVMDSSSWPSLSDSTNKSPPNQEGSSASSSEIPITHLSSPESESLSSPESESESVTQNSDCPPPPPPPNSDQRKFFSSSTNSRPAYSRPSRPYNQHNHHRPNYHNTRFPSHYRGRGGQSFHNNSLNNHYLNRNHQPLYHYSNFNQGFGPRPLHHQPQRFINGPRSFIRPPPYPYSNSSAAPINPPYVNAPPYGYVGENYFSEGSTPWYYPPPPPPYVDMMGGVPMNPQPYPMYMSQVDIGMCNAVLAQIEYYFSDINLIGDSYLKSKMDSQGWVSVHLITGFRKVKLLTSDINLVLKALRASTLVEGDKMRRRGDWKAWISPSGSVSPIIPTQNMLVDSMKNLQLDGESEAQSTAATSQPAYVDEATQVNSSAE